MRPAMRDCSGEGPVKIGRIGYTNVAPVYYGLDNGGRPAWLELVSGTPSALNRLMADCSLDISSVSSAAYARHQDDWLLLPDLSIASDGAVRSVLLVSRYPLADLDQRRVLLSSDSATAADLVKLLFATRRITPRYYTGTIGEPAELHRLADAALVIGDGALSGGWPGCFSHRWDLGAAWKELTGLPFVFALWAVRRDFAVRRPEAVAAAVGLFRASKEEGCRNLREIAAASAQRLGLGVETLEEYYRGLGYGLGLAEISGLETFFTRLHWQGLVPRPVRLSFFQE